MAEQYAAVRVAADVDPAAAAARFRDGRERLFRDHVDSPIPAMQRAAWPGLAWFPYDAAWRVVAQVVAIEPQTQFEIPLAADGILRCARVGSLRFSLRGQPAELTAYWPGGYGGGLWLPSSDATSGSETSGGGRYLYDTIKGADLGGADDRLILDFNFAYNPSCAYDNRWSCPLSPPENRLPFAVQAGERMPIT